MSTGQEKLRQQDQQARPGEDLQYRRLLTGMFPGAATQSLLQDKLTLLRVYTELLTPTTPFPQDLRQIAQALFGTDLKELDLDPLLSVDPEASCKAIEQQYRFGYYTEPLLEGENITNKRPSYGLFAPFYLKQLTQHARVHATDQTHRALLVGAITEDSPLELKYILETALRSSQITTGGERKRRVVTAVQTRAQVDVIDIFASLQMRQALQGASITFTEGNFLGFPPLASETYDSIQTNALFQDIRDENNKIALESSTREAFFQQVQLFLHQGGRLIMVEMSDDKDFAKKVQRELVQAGFLHKNITIVYPSHFDGRRDVDRFMNRWNTAMPTRITNEKDIVSEYRKVFGIVAIK